MATSVRTGLARVSVLVNKFDYLRSRDPATMPSMLRLTVMLPVGRLDKRRGRETGRLYGTKFVSNGFTINQKQAYGGLGGLK
jgi:hypothetical protein